MLADWVTNARMSLSKELTCPNALSAVLIIWFAIWLLLIAWFVLAMLLLITSLAIKPAGSSAPELIRKPVLNRVRAVCNWLLDFARLFWAVRELTFVLMRVIPEHLSLKVYVQASPDRGEITFQASFAGGRHPLKGHTADGS